MESGLFIQPAACETLKSIDAAIAEKWPTAPLFLDQGRITFHYENVFLIVEIGQNLAGWIRHE